MLNQKKVNEILNLVERIVKEYLQNEISRDVKFLKDKLKDFLTNPIWNIAPLFQLRNEIKKLELSDNEFKSFWDVIDIKIDELQSSLIESKPYIYQGKIREYEIRLIDFFMKAGLVKGQSPTFTTIIGYLLIHKRLTQMQLRELTGFSRGAISNNLNLLKNTGLVSKELIKGTRKHYYTFGGDMSQVSSKTGIFKKELNDTAKSYFMAKLIELKQLPNKKGYNLLFERISAIMNFLNIHKKILDIVLESELIKAIEMKKI